MSLPRLTPLQYAVLRILIDAPDGHSGREIRRALAQLHGARKSGPAFYQLMSRLEQKQFLEGWYAEPMAEGQILRERHYRLLAEGREAMEEARSFFVAAKPVGRPAIA